MNAAAPQKKILDKKGKTVKPAFSKTVGGKRLNFEKLVIALEAKAKTISFALGADKVVAVEAIDLMSD